MLTQRCNVMQPLNQQQKNLLLFIKFHTVRRIQFYSLQGRERDIKAPFIKSKFQI